MAESAVGSVGTDVYIVVEVPVARLGQPMSGTSWVAAKNEEKNTRRFGGPETNPFPLRMFLLLLMS